MTGRKMQVFRMGVDPAKGRDQKAYWCRECGPTEQPCHHLDAFLKTQQQEGLMRNKRESAV